MDAQQASQQQQTPQGGQAVPGGPNIQPKSMPGNPLPGQAGPGAPQAPNSSVYMR